jgi:hypothetical protein
MNDIQQQEQVFVDPAADVPKNLRIPARIISYVFHPVFMPLVMAIAIYKLAPLSFAGIEPKIVTRWLAAIGINTVLFPLLSVALLKGVGFIKSIHMHDAKDRIIPLIATMIFYFWAYLVVKNVQAPFVLRTLILGSYWGIIAMFLVSIFYKISMHTTAAGGMLGILIVLMMTGPINMQVPLFVAIVIAGLMGTARLVLRAHTQVQIWLGYVLGIAAMLAAYVYLK